MSMINLDPAKTDLHVMLLEQQIERLQERIERFEKALCDLASFEETHGTRAISHIIRNALFL